MSYQNFLDNYNNNQFNNQSILNPITPEFTPMNTTIDPSFRGTGILNNPVPNVQPMSSAGGMRTNVGGNSEGGFFNDVGNWFSSQFDEGGMFTSPKAYGTKDSAGWLSGALGAGQALAGGILGYQKLQLGKDQLDFSKQVGKANINNQVQDYNRRMNDRYAIQYNNSENKANMLTPEEYAAKNNLKGI